MTSSENMASYADWMSTTAFSDSWLTEAFARDTETLTKALQNSISGDTSEAVFSPFFRSETTTSVSASGSDFEAVTPRSRAVEETVVAAALAPVDKKIAKPKRKPRVSKKKSQTTFIMTDPTNFRQMVQQVTGIKLDSLAYQQQLQIPAHQILKPEPKRVTGMSLSGASLPTLDTSSFLLEQQQHQQQVGQGALAGGEVSYGDCSLLGDGSGVGSGSSGSAFGYGSYQNFPTLESWKVM